MSFKPFGFQYNPPPTVPSPAPTSTPTTSTGPTVVPTGTTSGAIAGSQSRAGILITQLNNLTAMSQYLQDVIVARTGKIAIEIDPAADPLTAKALSAIYGTDTPPQFVTVSMYDKILDAQMGAQQLEMSVGADSVIQPNPMQVADLATVVSTINSHLVASPSYNNWLPLQLASLKSDSIVFQSWAAALAQYPAYYATQNQAPTSLQSAPIQASSVDVSDSINDYQTDAIGRFNTAYANVYQSLASPSPVEQDLGNVMGLFFQQPPANMLQISSSFTALGGLAHKTNMGTLQSDMINFSFSRLASDTSGMLHQCDILVSLTIRSNTSYGAIDEVTAAAQQKATTAGVVPSGPMAGMSNDNASVTGNTNSTLTTPNLGTVSEGVKQLGETLNWSRTSVSGNVELLDKSFRQLTERRLTQQNGRQSLMDSQRSMDSMSGLASGVVSEQQAGTLTQNSTPQQQQDAVNRILSSLQTGSSTTFVAAGNEIIANPPDMPPVNPQVQSVLTSANINTTKGTIQT